jgi:hypothetical protein
MCTRTEWTHRFSDNNYLILFFKSVSFSSHDSIYSDVDSNECASFLDIRTREREREREREKGKRDDHRNSDSLLNAIVWTYSIWYDGVWSAWLDDGNTLYISISYWFDDNDSFFFVFVWTTSLFLMTRLELSQVYISVVCWTSSLVAVVNEYIYRLF